MPGGCGSGGEASVAEGDEGGLEGQGGGVRLRGSLSLFEVGG